MAAVNGGPVMSLACPPDVHSRSRVSARRASISARVPETPASDEQRASAGARSESVPLPHPVMDGAAAGRRLLHIQANRSARRSRCWSARCSWWTIGGQNPVETGRNPGQNPSGPESLFSAFCRQKADPAVRCGSACHAEGRGFESLQPLPGMPRPGVVEVAIPLGVFDERKHDGRMPRRRRGHHKK
jgi:hypothetical protein